MSSTAQTQPPTRDPAWLARVFWTGAALALLWPLLVATEFQPWQLWEARSRSATGQFLRAFMPPAVSADFLQTVAQEAWRTVAIATAGLALAPASLSARVLSVSSLRGRMSAGPYLLWQSVREVGMGPTAGVRAIALTYGGMLGKVYSEILDSGEQHVTQSLLRNGCGRLQALCFGLLPQNAGEPTSYTVYRWECAIPSSVVLGFVGAGGLSQMLDGSMKMFAAGEVCTVLLVFFGLVALADRISAPLRRALA